MAATGLNQLETDFVEFMALRQGESLDRVERRYRETKARFDLGSERFVKTMEDTQYLHRLVHDNHDDASSIRSYRAWDLMSVLRQISYSLPRPRPTKASIFKKALFGGQFHLITTALAKRLLGKKPPGSPNEASMGRHLADLAPDRPTVLDYGCGLAYISFEIGRLKPETGFILVDVDCLGLAFTAWRFARHGLNVETVVISEEDPYPLLPPHDVCIATDVMEHLWQPARAFDNITASLAPQGVLYGQFNDFDPGFWHISPDLSSIRRGLERDYEALDRDCFRRRA